MASINLLKTIGMFFFFIKFHIFIAWVYVINFLFHLYERLRYGSSKRVVCPYKNTHEHVFLTICTTLVYVEQLIALEGFSIREYEFETPDKAYVSFWRVQATEETIPKQKYPILLLHGLLDCSISWFLHADKTKCLPYILAAQGYDVWVGNNRGTKHSLKNSNLPDYWDFSFDHFVEYDQPTLINSVLKQTQSQKLIYIAHSQGSTQFLVSTGIHDFKDKIACFIGMGTVISLQNVQNHAVLKYINKFKGVQILKLIGFKTVLSLPKWVTKATGILIYNNVYVFKFFLGIVNALCGTPVVDKIDKSRLGVIISHEPGGASIPNVMQWVQFYNSGKMRKFDHGKNKNKALYGTDVPPEYKFDHLQSLPFKSYIFKGEKDAVMSNKDYAKLQDLMGQENLKTYNLHDYAHLDYVWGMQAHEDIYKEIVQILRTDEK